MGVTAEDRIEEAARRIVEAADPDRIIVFGSAARGAAGASSDVDLLVVKRGTFDHGRVLG